MDIKKLRGLSDKGIGVTKEFWGHLLDRESLVKEGEAQQERGTEYLKAFKLEVEADKHDAKAQAAGERQKIAQKIKESA